MSVIQGQDGKAAAAKYASVGLTQLGPKKYRSLQFHLIRTALELLGHAFALARRYAPEGLRPSTPGLFGGSELFSEGVVG